MIPITLDAVPFPLRWLRPARDASVEGARLEFAAGSRCDWFIDPDGGSQPVLSAPALVGEPNGDFMLSAHVTVEFGSTFDAGVLMVYAHERAWAKLCFEYSPQAEPMVVSVVTRGVSDDCNSEVIDRSDVWLRIARLGAAFAFHASTDGQVWRLVRYFALEPADAVSVGFEAQSPLGEGCRVVFDEIHFEPVRLAGLRSGA